MLTIDLDLELERKLAAMAEKEHRSPSEIIKNLINQYVSKDKSSELLVDIAQELPRIACFSNQDPLELQRALRDEWN